VGFSVELDARAARGVESRIMIAAILNYGNYD